MCNSQCFFRFSKDLKAVKSLLAWLDMAPLENVARVLESAFFPQWHSALKRWLRTEACDETCFGKVFYV